ncbi:UDP-N-acetylglucosamine 1-carboxyvinyltransferase [Calditrichota bacterium LG25]
MARFLITGEQQLQGEIKTAGNKNAALPIIAATLLTEESCILRNMPEIRDVHAMLALLKSVGKKVERLEPNVYRISGGVNTRQLPYEMGTNLRASILFLGGLLPVTGEVHLPPPGGCVIGRRNLDAHFDVAASFGAQVEFDGNVYLFRAAGLLPAHIWLREASVTATANALLIAARTAGQSVIENAACEPHIGDLCSVLTKMGAQIKGIGSNKLQIIGRERLTGFEHDIVPDHIEAGTFAITAACLQSELVIHNALQEHLRMIAFHLQQMNVDLQFIDDRTLQIKPSKLISKAGKVQVGLWPGFPTDLMSPMIVLATQAQGMTLCHDWMYESRMFFIDKLSIMGANAILCDPHRVIVHGPARLKGQELSSPDIRAGIALLIAAMAARGQSVIDRIELIDRGYENIDLRLNKVGADIKRMD